LTLLDWSTTEFTADDFDYIGSLEELFKFQGLDLMVIYKTLRSRAETGAEFKKDMAEFAKWLATRGTNVRENHKSFNKTGDTGKQRITDLINKYKIFRDKNPVKSTDVSMSRLAAVLPFQIAQVIAKFPSGYRVIGTRPENLPQFYCFPAAGAIIPLQEHSIMEAWKSWYYTFVAVVTKTTVDKINRVEQDSYLNAIATSVLMAPHSRTASHNMLMTLFTRNTPPSEIAMLLKSPTSTSAPGYPFAPPSSVSTSTATPPPPKV